MQALTATFLALAFVAHAPPAQQPDYAATPSTPPSVDPPANPTNPQPPLGEDEVALTNGGFIRGTITEMIPNESVTIVDGSGSTRTLAWSDIAEVQRGKHSTTSSSEPTSAATPPAKTPTQTPPERAGTQTVVKLNDTKNRGRSLTLNRVVSDVVASGSGGSVSGVAYKKVCEGSCDVAIHLEPGDEFFITSRATFSSRRFSIPRGGTKVVDVRSGVPVLGITGLTLLAGGLGLAVLGGVFLGMGSENNSTAANGAMLGGGLAATAIGIPMFIFGRHKVEMVRAGG